jgi:Arc/MetJ-type ribon-helix-helix transcriptional regulator
MSAQPTTQTGVASLPQNAQESQFQNLFDAGAFEPTPPKTPPPGEQSREPPRTVQESPAELAAREQEERQQQQPAAEEGEGEPQWASLEEYLTHAKLDPQAFQTLPVTVKIDGETRQVPLADVIKSYQLEGHVNNKSIELSNQQRQFETERDTAIALYRQQLAQAQNLGQLAQAQLMGEFNQINWTQLRQTDPVQWTALQLEFNNRSAAINQHLREVAAAQEAQQQQLQQQQAALLPKEREKMLERVPEWRDVAKFDADRQVMSSYAKSLGFNDAELNAIHDHRYMAILHDAAQFRALQAQNPEILKRVRAAPPMARPGTRTQRDPKAVAKQQAIERFNKNPRDLDAQAAVFEALS